MLLVPLKQDLDNPPDRGTICLRVFMVALLFDPPIVQAFAQTDKLAVQDSRQPNHDPVFPCHRVPLARMISVYTAAEFSVYTNLSTFNLFHRSHERLYLLTGVVFLLAFIFLLDHTLIGGLTEMPDGRKKSQLRAARVFHAQLDLLRKGCRSTRFAALEMLNLREGADGEAILGMLFIKLQGYLEAAVLEDIDTALGWITAAWLLLKPDEKPGTK